MTSKDKLKRFLELQSEGVKIDEIADKLDMEIKALRRFLNKNGYKSIKGKYTKQEEVKKNVQQLELSINEDKSTTKKQKVKSKPVITNKSTIKNTKTKSKSVSKATNIKMTAEDMDKLCEVYDWYLSIKDLKTLQPKRKKISKDINIEEFDMSNLKSTSIKIEKSTWEEFERLCSNSEYTKQEIVTQAIKNFLKEYNHLL